MKTAAITAFMKEKKLYAFTIEGLTEAAALQGLLHSQPYSYCIATEGPDGHFTLAVFHPIETIETTPQGAVRVSNKDQQLTIAGDPLSILEQRLMLWQEDAAPANPNLPAFQGGAAGYFGPSLERAVNDTMPGMAVGIYDQMIAFNHQKAEALYIVHADSEGQARARFKHAQKILEEKAPIQEQSLIKEQAWPEDSGALLLQAKTYEQKLEEGEIFQIPLIYTATQTPPDNYDAAAHFFALREQTIPVKPSVFLNGGETALMIYSSDTQVPNALLVKNRHVEAYCANSLSGTHKNIADEEACTHNSLVLDVLRNDLARVCEEHSIEVPQLCATFSAIDTVQQPANDNRTVYSTVTGTLRADMGMIDLLRAVFPHALGTGIPRTNAMNIMQQNRGDHRGLYGGYVGLIGFHDTIILQYAAQILYAGKKKICAQAGVMMTAGTNPEEICAQAITAAHKMLPPGSKDSETEQEERRPA